MPRSNVAVAHAQHLRIAGVLADFLPDHQPSCVRPLGRGNINDTYLIDFPARPPVVMQRINREVFPVPEQVAENVSKVTIHLRNKQDETGLKEPCLEVIQAQNGMSFSRDGNGDVWRLLGYIDNSISFKVVSSDYQAFEGGRMLGRFHHHLEDFDYRGLVDPLPGFHDLAGYCRRYSRVVADHRRRPTTELSHCLGEADRRLVEMSREAEAREKDKIPVRVIHGDPKFDNVLFDTHTGRALAMVDLDTVAVGLLQNDLGDCLRSFCNPAGEQPANPSDVRFDLDICRQVLRGYRASGAPVPQPERSLIYRGVRLLTYELALRFLTDYLEGNRYFKVTDENENLRRSMVQFHLLQQVERQQREIDLIALQV